MSDWRIPEKAAREHADEFARGQYKAFLEGFKAASAESADFAHLREWAAEQRDEANERYHSDHGDDADFARYLAFCNLLTKLSEMGAGRDVNDYGGDDD